MKEEIRKIMNFQGDVMYLSGSCDPKMLTNSLGGHMLGGHATLGKIRYLYTRIFEESLDL